MLCGNCGKKFKDTVIQKHTRMCKYANNFTKNKKNIEDIDN